ncbi:hypothetical protein IAQ61_008057 [Plenodomus lingam]|uniref:uncharacterized protein n=1 Tax=Leptosphaeria maculans TaxID=5022 RepID=UPI0033223014|nr:hypothetical protein IAQ61_008057 [Plenodomus lingam]
MDNGSWQFKTRAREPPKYLSVPVPVFSSSPSFLLLCFCTLYTLNIGDEAPYCLGQAPYLRQENPRE